MVRARQLQEIKRRGNNSCTISQHRERRKKRKKRREKKGKKIEITEQYDDIFSQLDQCQIFSIESLKLLNCLDGFHVEAYAQNVEENPAILRDRRKKRKKISICTSIQSLTRIGVDRQRHRHRHRHHRIVCVHACMCIYIYCESVRLFFPLETVSVAHFFYFFFNFL